MRLVVGSSSSPDTGQGISSYARELSEALISEGHIVTFYSPSPRDHSWLINHDISFLGADQNSDPRSSVRNLINHIRTAQIDGIINNDNPFLQCVAPVIGCPFISIGHMDKSSVATLACFNTEWVDYIVAISSDMQRNFVLSRSVPLYKCPIIYSGVKDPSVPLIEKSSSNGPIYVVFAGGENRNKGAYKVLGLLQSGKKRLDGVRFGWFGEVSDSFRQQLGNINNVHFFGRVPRNTFLEELRSADALLLPSYSEGCPMTMLEAMSHAVVPIASDGRGAMARLVISGKEGFICHLPRFVDQSLGCLEFLRDNRSMLGQMQGAVRNRYLAEFQSKHVVENILFLLKNPTIDRRNLIDKIQLLRWHRPTISGSKKAPLFDRLCIRLGYLRRHGLLMI